MNSGDQYSTRVRLNQRDEAILTGHFPAYRITTHEALCRTRWPDAEIDAVKKWTLRMREAGYIAEAPLWTDSMVYFRLTPQATARFQLPAVYGRPLTPHQLSRAYGVLSFCLLGPKPFVKLLPGDFRKQFPELVSDRLEEDYYYLDTDFQDEHFPKDKRIGYVYVDAEKRVRDVVRRCREVISQRSRHNSWYHEILHRHRFIYAVVTTHAGKRNQILEDLSKDRRSVPIRVEVREDLRHVIPLRKHPPTEPDEDL